MSGGHFEYQQYRLNDMAMEIKEIVACNKIKDYYNYSKETIAKFRRTIKTLEKAANMVQRIDWLVSGDDGEETFHKRWKEDVG